MSTDTAVKREKWGSRWGFILAASGSAIGLGNIVMFSGRAYTYGAGAFYVPYLIALIVVGVPLMILEFGLGYQSREAFPQSLGRIAGRGGEMVGWWAIMNATFIVMYYVTILGWVVGMLIGSLGDTMWQPDMTLSQFGGAKLDNPQGFFYDMISSWGIVACVVFVWLLNALVTWRGIRSIEVTTKILVPLMWVMMLGMAVRGLWTGHGMEGVKLLFTPQFDVMGKAEVWQGAFGQIFFSLSLGFGIMTAYASRLDKQTDIPSTAMSTSFLNCAFEFIAGIAIFSLLFHFAIAPQASTLSMTFWIVPEGIRGLDVGMKSFAALFFTLLLLAGLSSTISLVEALASAVIDKFKAKRSKVVLTICLIGLVGSIIFALPIVVDQQRKASATLGLTLLDLIDHWTNKYGLLIVGLIECLIVGWGMGVSRISDLLNRQSKTLRLGNWYAVLIQYVIPLVLIALLTWSIFEDCGIVGDKEPGLYGHNYAFELGGAKRIPIAHYCFFAWLGLSTLAAGVLTLIPAARKDQEASS